MNISHALRDDAAELLAAAGVPEAVRNISCCSSGGNNRIYRVDTDHSSFAAKQYFRHDLDTRDRLGAEYAFLTYAASAAPGATPAPYACSRRRGVALYEFVHGRRFATDEVGWPLVRTAAGFFRALNNPGWRAKAESLPVAAEACFSIEQHLELVGDRIRLLSTIAPTSSIDRSASVFGRTLASFWRSCVSESMKMAAAAGLDVAAPLDRAQRCISPSDFGFHNALAENGGAMRFLDFEYAGWDDPAKTAGDFFAQLAVPVPQEFFEPFVEEIMRLFPGSDQLIHRARLLRPIYQMKWCCIALNVFLPVHLARRKFADPELDERTIKETQLAKAEQLLDAIAGRRG